QALPRERSGKGAARATRREGYVPGVIYGDNKPPVTIKIEHRLLKREVQTGAFTNTLYMVNLDGKKTRVIPKDVQYHPVTDIPLHVDLLRLSKGARTDVEIPVNFLNEEESPGLVRGGVLNIVRHTIEISVPADAIPEQIEVDLTGLDIGDGVHISDIKLPEGATPTITDRDFTIATIAAPTVVKEPEEEEAEAAAEEAEAEEAAEGEEAEEGGESGEE
ncbi:MAG: 50S ribosomal protein L25/general stress protein Ctc, partial [Alphaproteobacteria bacterium]